MKYNVGMYGGSFNPLHIGHVDCIIQAANLCKELYIVLSVGVNRDEIDYRIRYRWLYNITEHIGNVKIIILRDEAKAKDAYTEFYWNKDAEIVKKEIGKKIDVVFCGSDYDKNSFWNVCYPESELIILDRGEISSTKIRENPYKYWNWIPNIVKPYYTKKVMIIGGESTGKSTLTINLANYFNTNYIEEVGRNISERSGTDLMMISEDFTEILLQHKLNEINALKYSNKVLFIDTDTLVTQFYLDFLDDKNKVKNKKLSDAIDEINEYDLILFLEPDVEFVQDGDRSVVIANDRELYSNKIKEILKTHNKNYHCIKGSYQERYKEAISLVSNLLK